MATRGCRRVPGGYDVALVDPATVTLSIVGFVALSIPALPGPTAIGDYDGDGVADLMVKFDRQAVIDAFGSTTLDLRMVVSGQLTAGRIFVGSDVVHVIAQGNSV